MDPELIATLLAVDLGTLRSLADLKEHRTKVRAQIVAVNGAHEGVEFPADVRETWAKLTERDDAATKKIDELEARAARVAAAAATATATEAPPERTAPAAIARRGEAEIYDLSTVRANLADPTSGASEMRDRALRALDIARFPLARDRRDVRAYGFDQERAQEHVQELLDTQDREFGILARRILVTGHPDYRSAFGKIMSGRPVFTLTAQEQEAVARAMAFERAFTLGSTGLPVTFTLDPTLVPTSNGSVNPWRSICRVEQIVTNEWRGATSGAITAAYAAEATESSDNTPTLAQPAVPAVRAQAFVPFSIEVQQDWSALEREMAKLITDAKDDLEAGSTGFFGGNGTNQPTGLNAMTSATDNDTTTSLTFAVGDLYIPEEALPARFRPRASIVANRKQFNRTRQFDTNGGASLWMQLAEGLPNRQTGQLGKGLLGYPTYESTQMASTIASGDRILLMGDFNYYLIVDRVGMSIELIPHLVSTNHRPTGQRGLYAYWRNGGEPLSEAAFEFLKIKA